MMKQKLDLKNLTKKQKIIGAAAAVVLIIGIVVVKGMMSGPATAMSEAIAERKDLSKYYSFSGNIESGDVQNVVSTSNEPVKKFYVKEGDKVQVGDLLYELDSNSIQSTMTSASASLSNAQTSYASSKLDYERKTKLYAIGGISLEELENARDTMSNTQNQLTQAQVSYSQAQQQYDDTRCYAEVDGEIASIYVDENDSITQGTSIMDIVNYDNLEVNIKVDEYDLPEITEGMEAEVAVEAIGKTVTGTITEIAREAGVESGVSYFATTVSLPADSSLRVGLSAEVKVATQSAKNVIAIPVNAVSYEGSDAYVQRYAADGNLEKAAVTVGINNGTDIEIKSGLEEGDKVVYTVIATSDEGMAFSPGGAPGGGGAPEGGSGGAPGAGGGARAGSGQQ